MRGEGRVRIMHYSWWLLGLREKGLCSISVFEASTLPRERERTIGKERKNRGKGEGEREREKVRREDEPRAEGE